MKTRIGDFESYGTRVTEDGVLFTFDVEGEDPCFIEFFNSTSYTLEQKVLIPEDYRIGNVYSVVCIGQNIKHCCYLLNQGDSHFVDRYARLVVGRNHWRDETREKQQYGVFGGIPVTKYTWKHSSPRIAPADMILYKLHVRGFSMNHGMRRGQKGTYKGVIAGLDGLKELGITSLELQPIYDFEEMITEKKQSIDSKGQVQTEVVFTDKINYWGYGPAFHTAPKASYFGGKEACDHCREMIDAIHGKNMEVILEMSFTQEASADYILDCLWYWVKEYRVDGFHLLGSVVPIERIAEAKGLAHTKIFFDHIPGEVLEMQRGRKHLFVYDDSFLCVCRQIQNHMEGSMVQFTNYLRRQNDRYGFVNYIANTSGFTLADSYSYGEKHNRDNGEENRDGNNINYSYNYGAEGETKNRRILSQRMKAMRNGLCSVFLSQAVPLLQAGDEVANSQGGNNNPYCQDNPVGWVQYGVTKGRGQLLEFTKKLIQFRKEHPVICMEGAMKMSDYKHFGVPDLSYHGQEPWLMGIGEEMKAIGILYGGDYRGATEDYVYVIYNYHYEDVYMAIPKIPRAGEWSLVMNTEKEDTFSFLPEPLEEQKKILVPKESVSILTFKKSGGSLQNTQ